LESTIVPDRAGCARRIKGMSKAKYFMFHVEQSERTEL
jgi:hypothetical protein